jgi:hypothetical protein
MSNQTNHHVNLEENSKYRVAFDLCKLIASHEATPPKEEAREYHLRLIRQCILAQETHHSIDTVVSGKKPQSMAMSW